MERDLTGNEYGLAIDIRDNVPRSERLYVCQEIAQVIEDLRDSVWGKIELEVWEKLTFPRYQFFGAAMPNEGWEHIGRREYA